MAQSRTKTRRSPRRIGEILSAHAGVPPGDIESALLIQRYRGGRLGEILVQMRSVSPKKVAQALEVQQTSEQEEEE